MNMGEFPIESLTFNFKQPFTWLVTWKMCLEYVNLFFVCEFLPDDSLFQSLIVLLLELSIT